MAVRFHDSTAVVWTANALILLLTISVDGLLCPLNEGVGAYPNAGTDIADYVSMCSMCSSNEAAVRWRRLTWTRSGPPVDYRFFQIRYNCSGGTYIPLTSDDDDETDCHWAGYVYPITRHHPSHGIVSVGRELINGTQCDFHLFYTVYTTSNGPRSLTIKKSCTVSAECEGEGCGVDQECTFSNETTDEVKEGYCTECHCIDGYSGKYCDNIDECEGDNLCHDNATCRDTDGSYWCKCKPGFRGDGYICNDVDECGLETYSCRTNSECRNTKGSYLCECNPGFEDDGYNCTDFDECDGNHECHENAECYNDFGSYWCKCLPGFQGDGYDCMDVDECVVDTHSCSEYEECRNGVGSFECLCKAGFTGDQHNCTDIDECIDDEENNLCTEPNTICINTLGDFSCNCIDGYHRFSGQCWKAYHPGYILLMTVAALIVAIAVLAVTVLFCLWLNRPRSLNFDELAMKDIDPFYRPKFWGGSVSSIKSEYEFLYNFDKLNYSRHNEALDSGFSTDQSGGFKSAESTNYSEVFQSGLTNHSVGFESAESTNHSEGFELGLTNHSGGFESAKSTNQSEDAFLHLFHDITEEEEVPVIIFDFPSEPSNDSDEIAITPDND